MTKADKKMGITKKKYREYPDEHRHRAVRRKAKKPWRFYWQVCPFCDADLPALPPESLAPRRSIFNPYAATCAACGASRETAKCPCCKRATWEKDGEFKHQEPYGCGFRGRKLEKK
jgi:hypothetical protein